MPLFTPYAAGLTLRLIIFSKDTSLGLSFMDGLFRAAVNGINSASMGPGKAEQTRVLGVTVSVREFFTKKRRVVRIRGDVGPYTREGERPARCLR